MNEQEALALKDQLRTRKRAKVVNLFGAPSVKKSTRALLLTGMLKDKRLNAEYASEFAKTLTWQERHKSLDDQLYVLSKQHHSLYMLQDKVDWIITDSPILLSVHYAQHDGNRKFRELSEYRYGKWLQQFTDLVLTTHHFYDNINYYLERGDTPYVQAGRNQTEEEAKKKDPQIRALLDLHMVKYTVVKSLEQIVDDLQKHGFGG